MPVTNELDALSILDYGGVRDATVPGSGNNAAGTSNSTALSNMLAAAQGGQLCIIPYGNWRFSTGVVPTYTKRINLLVLGSVYVDDGVTLIDIAWTSGQYIQHTLRFVGLCFGRVNIPSHTKTTYDAGTQPDWSAFGSHLVRLKNVNQVYVETNRCEGFKSPVKFESGAGLGGQENTVLGRFWYKNAYGVYMINTDGSGWQDKNIVRGVGSGTLRVSGGMAIYIDGFSGGSPAYNGAFRSNKFEMLIEQVDELIYAHGDITEPEFNITIEGGVNTGVFSPNPIDCRTTDANNNVVRQPRYNGRGVIIPKRLGTAAASIGSLGVNAEINMAIWDDDSVPYLGRKGWTDGAGVVIVETSYATSKTNRDGIKTTYPFMRFVSGGDREDDLAVSASGTANPGYGVRRVYVTASGVTVALPSASSSVDRYLTVYNDHASAAVTVSNVKTGGTTSIAATKNQSYYSDGAFWRDL